MPTIRFETDIQAPITRCFDLARSIDLHQATMESTKEKVIGGVVTGLIELDEEVTFRAKHFGVWQTLTSRVVRFSYPDAFRDSMVKGAFKRFDHDHLFEKIESGTKMTDIFDFDSPLGFLGKIANTLFLTRYMTKLLKERALIIKDVAEGSRWQQFLPEERPLNDSNP